MDKDILKTLLACFFPDYHLSKTRKRGKGEELKKALLSDPEFRDFE